MTSVINEKIEKINKKSMLDQRNFIFKFTKKRYFLKEEKSTCYSISKKDSEYIHKKLKEHNEINNACKFLKEFKNKNKIHVY